jgi:hypothetical protein
VTIFTIKKYSSNWHKTIGQAKIAGSIIENVINESRSLGTDGLDKVAVVLGDENMLVPLLYSLPASVGALNITMGYSSKNNPAQILIAKLFKMHTNALTRNAKVMCCITKMYWIF